MQIYRKRMYLPDDSFIGSFLEIVTLTSTRKMELKIQFRNPFQSSEFSIRRNNEKGLVV